MSTKIAMMSGVINFNGHFVDTHSIGENLTMAKKEKYRKCQTNEVTLGLISIMAHKTKAARYINFVSFAKKAGEEFRFQCRNIALEVKHDLQANLE